MKEVDKLRSEYEDKLRGKAEELKDLQGTLAKTKAALKEAQENEAKKEEVAALEAQLSKYKKRLQKADEEKAKVVEELEGLSKTYDSVVSDAKRTEEELQMVKKREDKSAGLIEQVFGAPKYNTVTVVFFISKSHVG